SLDAVRAALQDEELGLEALQVRDDLRPDVGEHRVVGAWRQWQVEFRALRISPACLLRRAGPRIKVAAVLVQIGENHRRIALESIEDAVTVVRVDVYVGDTAQPEPAAKQLDGNPAVVEDAEAGSVVARGVVESGDRHERMTELPRHDALGRCQRRAHHTGCGLVYTAKSRRITRIEVTLPARRAVPHELDVARSVKREQLLVRGIARLEHPHRAIERARAKLPQEGRVTIRSEGMAVTEAVARETLAGDHHDLFAHGSNPRGNAEG